MGSPVEESKEAIVEREERGDHSTMPDPDEASAEEIRRELAGQLAIGHRKHKSIQRFFKNFLKWHQQKFHLLAKIHLAKQLEHQKLPQPEKGQCLPSAVHGG